MLFRSEEFARLNKRIEKLEEALQVKSCKYSITQENAVDEIGEENAIEREIVELENAIDNIKDNINKKEK